MARPVTRVSSKHQQEASKIEHCHTTYSRGASWVRLRNTQNRVGAAALAGTGDAKGLIRETKERTFAA